MSDSRPHDGTGGGTPQGKAPRGEPPIVGGAVGGA